MALHSVIAILCSLGFTSQVLLERTLLVLVMAVVASAQTFAQLQPPTRPTSFPLSCPQRSGKVVSWQTNLASQPNVSDVVQAAAGGIFNSSCFNLLLKTDGTVAVSPLSGSKPPNPPAGLSNVVQVAGDRSWGGYETFIALRSDGTAVSWGSGSNAFLPTNLSRLVSVVTTADYSAALNANGRVFFYGSMNGNSVDTSSWTNIVQLAAGTWRLVGLKANGTVVEAGVTNFGTTMPAGLSNVVQVAAGGVHTLALKSNGTVVGWGDTSSYGGALVPQGLSNVIAIAAGGLMHVGSHSLALKSNGTVVAWGYNAYGQTNVPAGLTNVIQISGAARHSTALVATPKIACSWSNSGFPYTATDAPRVDAGSGLPTTLAIHNQGSAPLNVQSVTVSPAASFSVYGGTSTTLATNGTVFFPIYCTDTSLWGTRTGTITIISDDPSGALSIPITSRTVLQTGSNGATPGSVTNFGTQWAWYLATTTLSDGLAGEAVRTGPTPHSGQSVMGASFQGPGLLAWKWKTSTEAGPDRLVCEVNGEQVAALSATNAEWKSQVIQLPGNAAQIRWAYRKDASGSFGEDAGYLSSVTFHKFTNSQVAFDKWSKSFFRTNPTPSGQLPITAYWAGGIDPINGSGSEYYRPFMTNGRLGFRYSVSKSASALTRAAVSTNLIEWSSTGLESRLLGQDNDTATIEVLSDPAAKTFIRLDISY